MNRFFPHEKVRPSQDELMNAVSTALEQRKCLLAHAPTGLGKTAAVLSPALAYALDNKLTVFFLTTRHTQHRIVLDTLEKIKKKHGISLTAAAVVGKKSLCPVEGIEKMSTSDFAEYCRLVREKEQCAWYTNTKKFNYKVVFEKLLQTAPNHADHVKHVCASETLCPYDMSLDLANRSTVIIADHYHIFDPTIRCYFLKKTGKALEKSIIVVDEGHNLAERIREILTARLTSFGLERAVNEARNFKFSKQSAEYVPETLSALGILSNCFAKFFEKANQEGEILVEKEELTSELDEYKKIVVSLNTLAGEVRASKQRSYLGAVARFLESWQGEDYGFARIFSIEDTKFGKSGVLSYRCLDPSILTGEIIYKAHSTIIMSGTLTPVKMYKNLLGFPEDSITLELESPFPRQNKLALIIPETTTKYTSRCDEQYKKIADISASIVNAVPGSAAVFFPSYQIITDVQKYFCRLCKKKILVEWQGMSREERHELLDELSNKKYEGVLLGVAAGSFGEGIDLPGVLKAVVVAGIPLDKPSLEVKELIKYYDFKFGKGKGLDYGYIMPAMTRCLQNAGRCIRSETDKGVLIFLDERYTNKIYSKYFPKDFNIEIAGNDYLQEINGFFNNLNKQDNR